MLTTPNPIEHVPAMIEILEKDSSVGIVCEDRFSSSNNPDRMKSIFSIGNRLLAISHNLLNGITLSDPLTGLRVLRWDILKGWKPKSQGFDIEVELNHYVQRQGFSIVEVPIGYRARLGEKKT